MLKVEERLRFAGQSLEREKMVVPYREFDISRTADHAEWRGLARARRVVLPYLLAYSQGVSLEDSIGMEVAWRAKCVESRLVESLF